jgi:dienelactone hydrolase
MRLALALALCASTALAQPTPRRPLVLDAPDGTKLAATYFPSAVPGPGILLLHQCNRERSTWEGVAAKLAKKGFHVLTMDYRGYGESGGPRNLELPLPERVRLSNDVWPGDVDVAFNWLRSQKGVKGDTFGAAGASCGVDQSIKLSKRHPEVKSLVLLAGPTNREGRRHLHDSRDRLPIFVSAAEDDQGAVPQMDWTFASSGNPTSRFVTYATGGHGTDMFKPHPDLEGHIVAWYEATLLGRGTVPPSTPRQASPQTPILIMLDEPDGPKKVAAKLAAEMKADPASPIFDANFVNNLGYAAVAAGDHASALDILRINTETLPKSSNAWDSLGDAYLAAGQRDKAKEASLKALELVDKDAAETDDRKKLIRDSAQAKLDQLAKEP